MNKWLLVASLAASASATCYYPDGSNAAKDYKYEPCGNSTTTYSTCCYFGEGDKCLANGLCNQPDRFDYRAACQNKDWSNCPEICLDNDSGTWFALQECGKNKYCCPPADGSDCCKSGAVITTLAAPVPDGDSEDASAAESGTASAGGAAAATGTKSSDATETSSSSDAEDKKGGAPIGAIVGGVVGGIAVIVLGLLAFFFLKRRGKQPATSSEGAVVVGGGTGSSGSNGSDISKEKAAAYKRPQSGVAEVEGTAGNVYTEADSTAISKARFNVRQEADEEARIAAEEKKPDVYQATAPQKEQQRFAEVEGSRGNVYTEADSQAISKARFDAWKQAEEVTQFSYQPDKPTIKPVSQNLTEVAGSPGNVYTEADSQPVTHVPHASSGLSSETSSPSITFHSAYGSPVNSHGHMTSLPHDSTTFYQLDQHSHETKPTQPDINLPGIPSFADAGENTGNTFTESVSQAINHPSTHQTSTAELSSPETKPGLDLPDIQTSGGSLWDVYASSAHAATAQPATHKINHQPLSEVEGSSGTLFTEADSHAISRPPATSFQLLGDNTATGNHTFTHTVESPAITSTESHSHTINIPHPATVTTTTSTPQVGADTPSSEEKPKPHQTGQSFAEAEGSPGNVYTEADSHPIGKPLPGKQPGQPKVTEPAAHHSHHHTSGGETTSGSFYIEVTSHSTSQEKPTAQKTFESSVVEIEASAGNRYTEADSNPIVLETSLPPKSTTNITQLSLPEIEGSQGTIFVEADSQVFQWTKEEARQQSSTLTEVEGSAGNVYSEADSKAINRTEKTVELGTPQRTFVAVEGSAGNVYSEADSKTVERREESRTTETRGTH